MRLPAKLLFGAIALALMFGAWRDSAAIALSDANPALALRIKPGDAQSLSAVVDLRTLGG